ncbi:hypothetical protein OSB04_028734 [Centaurea solstitialis]|uniref:Uncharacterized protein n=1 Tax=Centaurea solstitialis TaxID=347529 RepID=A0AA38T145_9ASTR|nr:hypothetical protein OSB04_028734 [Centaurea solstitialis]
MAPPRRRYLPQICNDIQLEIGLLYVTALFRPQPQNADSEIVVLWNPSIRRAVGIVVPRSWHPSLTSITSFWVC